MRACFLLALLGAEIAWLVARYEVPALPPTAPSLAAWLFHASNAYWQVALWVAGSCVLLLTPRLDAIRTQYRRLTLGHRWRTWLALHCVAAATLFGLTAHLFGQPTDPARLTLGWFGAWATVIGATAALWLACLAPAPLWRDLLRRERRFLFAGIALGIGAWHLVQMLVTQQAPLGQSGLWQVLSGATLEFAYLLLRPFYGELVYQPDALLLGTTWFPVEITYACSGIEGMALISLFLTVYMLLFRSELQWPRALWMIPLGIAAAWIANGFRIALLIAIGSSVSADIAINAFHTQAGWVSFTMIAIGAIFLAHRLRLFQVAAVSQTSPEHSASAESASPLLVPLLVLLAVSLLTSTVSGEFDALYLVTTVAVAGALWHFRAHYRHLGWTLSWQAPAIGAVVFVIWLVLEPPSHEASEHFAQVLFEQPSWLVATWLVFRIVGSIVVVPLAEELAFRGYLLRKLVSRHFESVAVGHFTWLSFVISSALFGLLHGRWLAATIAGMAFALALYRRRRLADAVIAHATANALIAAWVVSQGDWGLWVPFD